jgi:hypothetical protein
VVVRRGWVCGRWGCVLAVCVSSVVVFGLAGVCASAATTRPLVASFGTDGTAASRFEHAGAVAVDQGTGAVYVADYQAGTVEKFNSAHEPEAFSGINPAIVAGRLTGFTMREREGQLAASAVSHDFYVADAGSQSLKAYQPDGEPAEFTAGPGKGTSEISGFGNLCGVAVDGNGDIYASDYFGGVAVYAPSGELLTVIGITQNCNVAVDSMGTAYVDDEPFALQGVKKYVPSVYPVTGSTVYEAKGAVDETPGFGVAVDPVTNHVFVDERTRVAEYDEAGTLLGGFGALTASEGVAVDGTSDEAYVSDAEGKRQVQVFRGPLVVLADVVTGVASGVLPSSATLNGTVDAEGVQVTDCRFDYGPSEAYGQMVPCVESVGSGSGEVSVHADVSGLTAGTTYHFRLRAANVNGTEFGGDETFSTPPPPGIGQEASSNLTEHEADLSAQVNPEGSELKECEFQYGESVSYEHSVACSPGPALIGSGRSPVATSAHLSGLEKDVTYHWRVLATNFAGTTATPDHVFVYDTSAGGLPDGRAYEMVTPANKNAALIGDVIEGAAPAVAKDGSRLTLSSLQCFSDSASCVVDRNLIGTPFEFSRTSAGWVPAALAPPASQFAANSEWWVSPDESMALFSMPSPPNGQDNLYVRGSEGVFRSIGPVTPPELGAQGAGNVVEDASEATSNFSHVVFEEEKPFWPSFDESKGTTLYEYVGLGNSQPRLVGLRGGADTTVLVSRCGTTLGQQNAARNFTQSVDGEKVFFIAKECGAGDNGGVAVPAAELWVRVGGVESVLVSAKPVEGKAGLGEGCGVTCQSSMAGGVEFEGASADGSRVLFASTQQLTDGASQDPNGADTAVGNNCWLASGKNGCNLYEAELVRDGLGRVVVGGLWAVSAGDVGGGGPGVQGVMAFSRDGSRVFFVARGVLSEQANDQGAVARAGGENLYVWQRDGAHGAVRFIGTLSEKDEAAGGDLEEWKNGPASANVSEDGRFLLFTSGAALTRDDLRGVGGGRQVFRYDVVSGALVRVSVGDRGFNDSGNAGVGDAQIAVAGLGRTGAGYPQRSGPSMSGDGSRVFFMSPVGLTRGALNDVQIGVNGTNGVTPEYAENVYEYEGGRVFLISDGRDASVLPVPACGGTISAVCLVGTDASGTNVFFTSADRLVRGDTDTQLDFYDARICSPGAPCVQPPPAGSPSCSGEACHGTPPAVGGEPAGGSETFNGAGNVTPAAPARQAGGPLSRRQLLMRALRACRRGHDRHRRRACEAQARGRYGVHTRRTARRRRAR